MPDSAYLRRRIKYKSDQIFYAPFRQLADCWRRHKCILMNMFRILCTIVIILTSSAWLKAQDFVLQDFYLNDSTLSNKVDSIFGQMTDEQRVAQMIVSSAGELGKPAGTIIQLAKENKLGGLVFLKGSKNAHQKMIQQLNDIAARQNQLPLIFSIDAEPSLFNGRLRGATRVPKTIDIKDNEECDSIARIINGHLLEIGMHHNFAPVCDISPNNEAIKNRSFGRDPEKVISLSKQFINTSQAQGIIATAKHFPGHGLVKGDTHHQSVYIDGELQEVEIYRPLIDAGVLSIMIAHINIVNNEKYQTDGLPSTCSRKIVTDLLKYEMGFRGLIITDALNIMKAVTIVKDAPLLASRAGCDMLLMPIDENKTIDSILREMKKDAAYQDQVYKSVRKIIRLKLCAKVIR